MLSGEATNTNFIIFGLTRSELEPRIYRTRDEHANHYTNEADYFEIGDVVFLLSIEQFYRWQGFQEWREFVVYITQGFV